MEIIGMSGKMASGKDYTTDLIIKKLEEEQPGVRVERTTYATALRREIDTLATILSSGVAPRVVANSNGVSVEEILHLLSLLEEDSDYLAGEFTSFKRTPKAREILQYWGTEVRRKQDPSYWVKRTQETVRALEGKVDYVFVTDVRFPNEVTGVTDLGGRVIRLTAPESLRIKRLEERGVKLDLDTLTHPSETVLDNFAGFDFTADTSEPHVVAETYNYIISK